MTTKELIDELRKCPEDAIVCIDSQNPDDSLYPLTTYNPIHTTDIVVFKDADDVFYVYDGRDPIEYREPCSIEKGVLLTY